TYTVLVTNANGCTSSCSRTLTVNALPVCSITGNQFICAGGFSVFTASGGTGYSWTGPGGFTAATAGTGNITVAGTYTVTVTNANGCTSSCSRLLTVVDNPIIFNLTPTNFCAGDPAGGSITLSGSQIGKSYTLLNDALLPVPGQPVKAGTGGSLTWSGLAAGGYAVRATGEAPTNCANLTNPATVIENPLPSPTADAKEVCVNDCVTLTGSPAGGTWSGAHVSGNQFCATNLAPGPYTVTYTVTNAQTGCQKSATATITVKICGGPICTYTQGYYGNAGGTSCDGTTGGFTTDALIAQSLANWGGTLRIGSVGRSVVITNTPTDRACVIDKLPGGGASKELGVNANIGICDLPLSYLKNGRINNTLLAQTIALGLNVGITNPSTLGSFVLQAGVLATAKPVGGCGSNIATQRVCNYNPLAPYNLVSVTNEYTYRTFSAALINAIVGPKTIQGLLNLADSALANADGIIGSENGVSLSEIAGGAGSVNEVFDECRIFVGWNVAPCPAVNPVLPIADAGRTFTDGIASVNRTASVADLNVTAFPNPFTDKVRFVINSPVSGQGSLEVFNMAGQKLQTVFSGHVFAGKGQVVEYNVPASNRTNLVYKLNVDGKQVIGMLTNIK
ncbi:MAG: hypothetical protein ABIY51_09630, partial [Ferruginibacter sp.]